MSGLFLGIDTSNYKTSVSLIDGDGSTLGELSEFLEVPEGRRGLRQADAFFRHSNRLPRMIGELLSGTDRGSLRAIGASERPRRIAGSYMPCFLAGLNAALEMGSALDIPVFRFSHQEGHAAAVLEDDISDESVIFMHLSGGTTEILLCRKDEHGYSMEIRGGTRDISAGQLLDRAGVMLGYPFPAGGYLDDIAYEVLFPEDEAAVSKRKCSIIPAVRTAKGYFNLSGTETRLMRYLEQHREEAASVSDAVADTFVRITELLIGSACEAADLCGAERIIMAGGVASSRTVRRLADMSEHKERISFGEPRLCGDNAVGTARLARRIYTGNNP